MIRRIAMQARLALAATVCLWMLAGGVRGQTWTGTVSGSWNVASNWSPASVPANAASTQLIFDATANGVMTNDIPATLNIFNLNQMTFTANAPAYSLAGDTLSFHVNGATPAAIVMNSGNPVTIANDISMQNNLMVSGTGLSVHTLSGVIAGFTTGPIDSAAGILALTANNTYTGATTIIAGATISVPTITNGGTASPLGASSSAVGNLNLGSAAVGHAFLLLSGTNATYSTDRGVTIAGLYANGSGGAIGVQNAATALTWTGQITGSGSLIKTGAGTLALTNTANNYAGGAIVEGGTLAAGANGTVFPANSAVTVFSGATFDLGPYSNASAPANALGGLTLTGGTLRATGATNSDFFTQQLTMTAGTIDFTNTPFTWIHVTTAGGITVNANSTPSTWIGGGTSRIQNDTAGPMTITANSGGTLNAGIILSNGGTNPNFTVTGAGSVRLANTGNTANITVNAGTALSNDLSTNVGAGAFGTLGAGNFALTSASFLLYDGPTATTAKPMTITNSSIGVVTPGVNLTLSSAFSESAPGSFFQALGPEYPNGIFATGTVTVLTNNNYSGPTYVGYQGVLAIPTIANGGAASPIGTSSSDPANLVLGYPISFGGRGDLMLTGTAAAYSTDRGATVRGFYNFGDGGGAIGVQNAGTTLTWNGPLTGPGEFIKSGAGTLVLTNTTSNYQGGTVVEAGTLAISGANGAGIIPAGSAVAILTGAELNISAFIDSSQTSSALSTIFVEGGTLRMSGAAVRYYVNQLWCYSGSTVDMTIPASTPLRLDFINTGAAINILGNSTWTGPGSYMLNTTTAEIPISIPPNVTLTSSIDLSSNLNITTFNYYPFRVTGGGTLYLTGIGQNIGAITVSQGRLRVDNFTPVQDTNVTLDGGIFQYSGPTVSTNQSIFLGPNGGTVEVSNAATSLTITGFIGGFAGANPGPFAKAGPGVLAITGIYAANQFVGGVTVNGGRLEISDDAQLGMAANITVNQFGTLRYTASTTSARTFILNGGTLDVSGGATLTLNGATVGGGFMRGAGTFALTSGTALSGVTTFGTTTLNQTGQAALTNFTSGGTLTNASATTLTWNGGLNPSAGLFTVNGTAEVNDWSSNGDLRINGGGAVNNSGSNLVLGGGSRTTINAGGTINLSGGTTIELNGGLLVNNGTISGTTDVNYGSLAKGSGVYGVVNVNQGGIYAPGNSPGISTAAAVTFDHTAVSGAPVLQIELAGTAPGIEYDQLHVMGQLSLGGVLQVVLINGFAPAPGNAFDILDWDTLSGTFSSLVLPALSSALSWNTTQLYTTGVLSVTNASLMPGDFNRDGHVDASDIPAMLIALADLNKFQTANSLSAAELLAIGDIDGDGKLTNADVQALLTRLKSGGGSVDPVPEPESIVLLALTLPGLAIAVLRRRGSELRFGRKWCE